jgi:hypothetical protein
LAQDLFPGFVFYNGWHVLLTRNETEALQNTSTGQRDEKERLLF